MFTVIRIIIIAVLVLIFIGYIAKAVMHAQAAKENLKEMLGRKNENDSAPQE